MSEDSNSVLKTLLSLLQKAVGDIEREVPVVKQLDEEKMEAIEFLFPVDQDDLHGEQLDRDEARKMVKNMNEAIENKTLNSAIDHCLPTDGFHVERAWINEVECKIGDVTVPEGWPLCKTKFTSKTLWEARKSGDLQGVSIGAKGRRVIEDE